MGCIGAGKSTLARALGAKLGIEVFHLDRLLWKPGRYTITGAATVATKTMAPAEFRRIEYDIAVRDSWIIDSGVLNMDLRLSRADTVVFLDPPRRVCMWRLVKRHNRCRPDYPEDVREGLGWLWLLLRSIWKYPTTRRPATLSAIGAHARGATVFHLHSRREVRSFLDGVATGPTRA